MSTPVYHIHLPQFEGPFDLLLFFIDRDELDINDIPIAKITREFLTYLRQAEALNFELGSEFMVMAARLMKIKAAMLLPRPVLNEDGEVVDPRTELVDRLLEFKRFKQASEQMATMEEAQAYRKPRAFAVEEQQLLQEEERAPEDELYGLTLYNLLRTYHRVLEKGKMDRARPRHVIRQYPYVLTEVKSDILNKVAAWERVGFADLVKAKPNKIYVVFAFLAILELLQVGKLKLQLGEGYNRFWIEQPAQEASSSAA